MYDLGFLGRKARRFVDWLDGVPSVPAAGLAFVAGMLIPKSLAMLLILAGVFYLAAKFNVLGDETDDA